MVADALTRCIEGGLVPRDSLCAAAVIVNRDHVKPNTQGRECGVAGQEIPGGLDDAALLMRRDCFSGGCIGPGPPIANFNDGEEFPIVHHQVQFAETRLKIAREGFKTARVQPRFGCSFCRVAPLPLAFSDVAGEVLRHYLPLNQPSWRAMGLPAARQGVRFRIVPMASRDAQHRLPRGAGFP